jgi:hypothetical protein
MEGLHRIHCNIFLYFNDREYNDPLPLCEKYTYLIIFSFILMIETTTVVPDDSLKYNLLIILFFTLIVVTIRPPL